MTMLNRPFTASFQQTIDRTALSIECNIAFPGPIEAQAALPGRLETLGQILRGNREPQILDNPGRVQGTATENNVSPTKVY
jgi:hypothetical protein